MIPNALKGNSLLILLHRNKKTTDNNIYIY